MKKLYIAFLLCVCTLPSYALNWGVEAAYNRMPTDTFSCGKSHSGRTNTYGGYLFLEKEYDKDAFGIKIGFLESDDITFQDVTKTSNGWTDQVPVTIYYKYKVHPRLQLYGGLGATWTHVGQHIHYSVPNFQGIFMHVTAGVEWYLAEWFSIGANLLWNIDAELSKDQTVEHSGTNYYDYNGRYYPSSSYYYTTTEQTKIDFSGTQFGLFAKIYF